MQHQPFSDFLASDQPSPRLAFDQAIASGRLSRDERAANFAGNFMFMGKRKADGKLLFKCIATRAYLD